MTVWNLGSINADHVYALPHVPRPGETLAATSLTHGLGGKGANMSVACARGGGEVRHVGAVGQDGAWMLDRLRAAGVGTEDVLTLDGPSGHAIIAVGADGENLILLHPGANRRVAPAAVARALDGARPGDWFLTQNETSAQAEGAALARERGLAVAYAAAPFEAEAVRAVLPFAELLLLNEVEAGQLREATGQGLADLGVAQVIVTLGAEGCLWLVRGQEHRFSAPKVEAVDTTGAGDTFTGYVLALLDGGRAMPEAIGLASRAAALKVTRKGAADAIPTLDEVLAHGG